MKEFNNKNELQCAKCGNMCEIWSQYQLVMCPSCKNITDVRIECDDEDEF